MWKYQRGRKTHQIKIIIWFDGCFVPLILLLIKSMVRIFHALVIVDPKIWVKSIFIKSYLFHLLVGHNDIATLCVCDVTSASHTFRLRLWMIRTENKAYIRIKISILPRGLGHSNAFPITIVSVSLCHSPLLAPFSFSLLLSFSLSHFSSRIVLFYMEEQWIIPENKCFHWKLFVCIDCSVRMVYWWYC